MTFGDTIFDVIVSAASGAAVSGLLLWLVREWVSTRLKGSIQHEYNQKLETYKAEVKTEHDLAILDIKMAVAREEAFHSASHASFAEGQKAAMGRKLAAIDRLWSAVLHLRSSMPPVLGFMNILTVDEYRGAKEHPTFQSLTGDLSDEKITNFFTEDIEEVRPYVGEYLWMVFYCYRAILLRILFLLNLGSTDTEKMEWHKDDGILQLIGAVLTPAEVTQFEEVQIGKITWIQHRLEGKILAAAKKVISGESFSAESLEQAKVIQERIAQPSTENR